ncbi:hypothetical protein MES4922_190504 [Mesorhizobium ventifaucium]|uniref:Uncharacterized protein n=1 Tax=Mesorhizobium ventifaucium TaxID=666020 RepID=A0ABM9DMS0_9HYPH|nr:hypothetical protein MES4922_190504 [Mesorhizobium ventifaucium]
MGTCQAGGLILLVVRPAFHIRSGVETGGFGRLFCGPDQIPQIYVNLKLITIVSIKLTLF